MSLLYNVINELLNVTGVIDIGHNVAGNNNDNNLRRDLAADDNNRCKFIASVLKELLQGEVFEKVRPGHAVETLIQHIYNSHVCTCTDPNDNHGQWRSCYPKDINSQLDWFRYFQKKLFFYICSNNYLKEHPRDNDIPIKKDDNKGTMCVVLPFTNGDFNNTIEQYMCYHDGQHWTKELRGDRTLGNISIFLQRDNGLYRVWSIMPLLYKTNG